MGFSAYLAEISRMHQAVKLWMRCKKRLLIDEFRQFCGKAELEF
jgi:hypothetical protein